MTTLVRMTSITMKDGTHIPIPSEGTVILVGPNNVGKSQFLRDLAGVARDSEYKPLTLATVQFERPPASEAEVDAWIQSTMPTVNRSGQVRLVVDGWGEVGHNDVKGQLHSDRPGILTSTLLFHANSLSRLTAGDSQGSIDFTTQGATHPLHRAYRQPGIEEQLSAAGRDAFGLDVMVDRFGGSVIALRVGTAIPFESDQRGPTQNYLDALKSLPRLEDQGDGVRSYLGLTLHMLAGSHQIVLVDEPEAFLHPPQARLLGKVLAQRSSERQVVIATHSSDIVRGALDGSDTTTIIRLTRTGDTTHAAVLSNESLKQFWSDPIFQYSNILDGLFNDLVVVCEGDADCRYYSAVYDHLPPNDDVSRGRDPGILFTWSGGKARLHSIISALQAVGVPVLAIGDFDVFRTNTPELARILASFGRSEDELRTDLNVLQAAMDSKVTPLRKLPVKDEFDRRLADIPNDNLTPKDIEGLRAILKAGSGWDAAKDAGDSAVPQGHASEACARLIDVLGTIGLLIVPVGRLERFAPTVPGHGPAWISNVLDQGLHKRPDAKAVAFVQRMRTEINVRMSVHPRPSINGGD